ncbi:MAG: DNA replication protein DnaC [Verrucomicrobia bacterium]|nr:MAG: DNA replication protein DnaC [Verrucomicrobiota bacterium]
MPGRGKTHFLAALGRELILRHGKRVLFRPAFKRVGKLLAAKRDLRLEAELKKLDRNDALILDDIGYGRRILLRCTGKGRQESVFIVAKGIFHCRWTGAR